MFIFCCFLLVLLARPTLAEEIHHLPGLNFSLNFRHYSGFLQVSETHFLHYWFVESQNDPATDPLIFWFNGGPGCSSLNGMLNIMGPFLVNEDGKTLRENPHSWNKFSNIVYLESPAGVGFSYSTDGDITTNDDQTADENYEAIKAFFKEFSDFRNHSTFIFGESYGGVYAPMLAARMLDGQKEFPVNLKGVGVGNGRLNNGKLAHLTEVLFAYSHGFVSETDWKFFQRKCCPVGLDDCDLRFWSKVCLNHVQRLRPPYDLNWYDVYSKEISSKPLSRYLNRPEVRAVLRIPESVRTWWLCTAQYSPSWYSRQYNDMTSFIKKLIASDVRVLLYYGDTDYVCNFLMGQKFAARLGLKTKVNKRPWLLDNEIAGFMTRYEGLTFTTVLGAGHMAPKDKAPQTARLIDYFLRDFLQFL